MSNEVHEDQDKVTSHRRRRNNIIHSKGSSNAAVQKKYAFFYHILPLQILLILSHTSNRIISWTTIEMERWKKSFRCSQFLPQTHICFAKTPLSSMYLLSDVLFYSPLNSYSEEYGELHEWSMTLLSKYYLKKKLHLDAVIDLTNPNLLYIEDMYVSLLLHEQIVNMRIGILSIFRSMSPPWMETVMKSSPQTTLLRRSSAYESLIFLYPLRQSTTTENETLWSLPSMVMRSPLFSVFCMFLFRTLNHRYLVRCMNYSLEDAIPLCEKIKGARILLAQCMIS